MSQRLASTYGTVMATVRSFLVLYSTYSIYMRTTCRFPLLGGFEKKKKLVKRESLPSCSLWKDTDTNKTDYHGEILP